MTSQTPTNLSFLIVRLEEEVGCGGTLDGLKKHVKVKVTLAMRLQFNYNNNTAAIRLYIIQIAGCAL